MSQQSTVRVPKVKASTIAKISMEGLLSLSESDTEMREHLIRHIYESTATSRRGAHNKHNDSIEETYDKLPKLRESIH